jgi:hypothetical protein
LGVKEIFEAARMRYCGECSRYLPPEIVKDGEVPKGHIHVTERVEGGKCWRLCCGCVGCGAQIELELD